MIRTFVDASILIAAARGQASQAHKAMEILDDPGREFVSSDFVKLEVLPMPVYHGRADEVAFYQVFFASVAQWPSVSDTLSAAALEEACRTGMHALDALHVAAAVAADAAELVIAESPAKPIHRTKSLRVLTIHLPA